MPIQLKGFNPSSQGPNLGGVSTSAASAPFLALSSVAGAIGNAGDALYAHDAKIMEVQNAADLTELKTKMKTEYAEFQASLADDHDYSTYQDKWEERLGMLEKGMGKGNYSQSVKDKVKVAFEGYRGDTRLGVAASVQNKAVQRGKKAWANGFDSAIKSYDPSNPSSMEFDELLGDQSWMSPEDKEAAKVRYEEITSKKSTLADIHADPKAWLEDNPEPGNDPAEWEGNKRRAKALVSEMGREQADEVLEGIFSDKLTNPDDVDALAPDLGPAARERLKNTIQQRNSQEMREKMKSPEYQNQVTGEVSQLIAGYDPTGEDFDADYVGIRQKIAMLPSGPLKQEFESQLDGIRDGKEKEIKTVQDWGYAQIDEHHKAGLFGKVKEVKPQGRALGAFLDDGLLSDAETLQEFGFSEKQSKAISKLAEMGEESKAIDLLRKSWNGSSPRAEDFPTDKGAALDALRGHKGKTHMVVDPTAQDQAVLDSEAAKNASMQRFGQVKSELANYFKLNPKATMQEAAGFLEDVKIDVGAGVTNETWSPRPRTKRLDGVKMDPKAHLNRSDVPYNGIAANVRYNNPAAAYPRASDTKYGLIGYGVLNGGKQGMHKIGRFPTPVHGAAANFHLFADKYVGKSAYAAVRKWRGNGGRGEKTVVPKGYSPDMKITKSFLNDPSRAIDFFKKMAMHESPNFKGMDDAKWKSAWEMWKQGGANA